MGWKQSVSALTTTNDTTKTLIDTFTVPAGCSKIIGVASIVSAGATLTIAEAVSGIVELESDDTGITPAQFLTDVVNILTSGAVAYNPTQWPAAIPVKGGDRVRAYVTMDMAQTSAFKARIQLTYA
jgi:hypothetical protein